MTIFNAQNCINGKCCKAFATIDGLVEELFWIKTFEAHIDKSKADVQVMGDPWLQKKTGGLSGSGTMTVYYVSPLFRRLVRDYGETLLDQYFNLTIVNNDPASTAGTQSVVLNNVNIDGGTVAKFDVSADELEEDIAFTFSGVNYISEFNQPR